MASIDGCFISTKNKVSSSQHYYTNQASNTTKPIRVTKPSMAIKHTKTIKPISV